jgi:hypothetical protein
LEELPPGEVSWQGHSQPLIGARLLAPAGAEVTQEACAGNASLRRHIDGLMALEGQLGSFLERPAVAAGTGAYSPGGGKGPAATEKPADGEAPGVALAGRYKLVEEVGEGGMGSVWMAQQTQPVRRLVAVKLINAGMDTRQVMARFAASHGNSRAGRQFLLADRQTRGSCPTLVDKALVSQGNRADPDWENQPAQRIWDTTRSR